MTVRGLIVFALTLLGLALSSFANATTLYVKCGGSEGLTSINAAAKALKGSESTGPSTIFVSGACRENVLIRNLDRLTIAGINGASVTDASNDTADVFDISASTVTLYGLTIDGLAGVNFDAVDCEQGSACTLIGDTIQGESDCVGVYPLSRVLIYGGTLQNATGNGIFVRGEALIRGVRIQGNPVGVFVLRSGTAHLNVADAIPVASLNGTPSVITGNGGGIRVYEGGFVQCAGCMVNQNSGIGINVDVSSVAVLTPGYFNGSPIQAAVTSNGGVGVYVGDLSSAVFEGQGNAMARVSGNAAPEIVCASPTAVTRGALTAAGGAANTNCTN